MGPTAGGSRMAPRNPAGQFPPSVVWGSLNSAVGGARASSEDQLLAPGEGPVNNEQTPRGRRSLGSSTGFENKPLEQRSRHPFIHPENSRSKKSRCSVNSKGQCMSAILPSASHKLTHAVLTAALGRRRVLGVSMPILREGKLRH